MASGKTATATHLLDGLNILAEESGVCCADDVGATVPRLLSISLAQGVKEVATLVHGMKPILPFVHE